MEKPPWPRRRSFNFTIETVNAEHVHNNKNPENLLQSKFLQLSRFSHASPSVHPWNTLPDLDILQLFLYIPIAMNEFQSTVDETRWH